MPYTPAHPITAIVLDKLFPRKLNRTGLVLGTMAPDLQNFAELRPTDTDFGHSTLGMFTLGLPASIVLAFAFHRLVLPAAAVYLPAPLNRIAGSYVQRGWRINGLRGWALLIASIVLGMYSHLFLDGFSHRGGLMYPLSTGAVQWLLPGIRSPGSLLQFGLSVLGIAVELLLLAIFVYRRRHIGSSAGEDGQTLPRIGRSGKALFWLAVLSGTVLVTAFGFWLYSSPHSHRGLIIVPVAPLSGAVVGLLAASALHALMRKKTSSQLQQ
ncbi:DUF4184 family protein [Paenibacillus hodogayensis]|uniref:DUF4184 family protein n=1 Tax=Paenibacillus hodogayensis TaxID=279208 RepID=A0ABV5W4C7_9BACL